MGEISTQFGRRPWGEIENIWPSYLCIISTPGPGGEKGISIFKENIF